MFTPQLALACRDNHLLFAHLCWPQTLFYDKQVEIIESVRDNDETVVPAAHQMGKDFVSGFIALWYFLCHHPVRVVTTSVKDDHLRVLWGEVKRFIDTSVLPLDHRKGGPLVVMNRELRKMNPSGIADAYSYMIGMVSEDPAGLAGHHAKYSLIIYDEASGIRDEAFERTDTWAKRRLIIGNPYDAKGNYFQRAVKEGDIVDNRRAN